MKLASLVIVFAFALAGLGFACGPEQAYCYEQHKTCEQARLDKKLEEDRIAAEEAARRADAGVMSDSGATVVDRP
ncbi:MAG: hypothetical protein H7X95_14290 [Deltaproteobacteria bacterium]|nr:hypothetical protein [Deltaproteobacteria bacterium]